MRTKRIQNFEDKILSVQKYFLNKASKSDSAEYLQQYFGMKVKPNIEKESNPTWIEIYWEDRAIDIDQERGIVNEKGAKISLRCSVCGYVTVQLYPCSTETLKCKEDGIVLFHRLNPSWLDNFIFKAFLWRTFAAYSITTSIDGTPSILSRFWICLIRYFCTKNVSGILEGTRLWHDLKLLISLIFALVSSSLFVYFLPSRYDEKMNIIDSNLSKQSKLIDSLAIEIKNDYINSTKLDSIIFYQKLIEKNTKYKGGK